jgi:hypothetical protein
LRLRNVTITLGGGSLSTPFLWGEARGRGLVGKLDAWSFFSSVCKVNHDLPEKAMFFGHKGAQVLQIILQQAVPQKDRQTDA